MLAARANLEIAPRDHDAPVAFDVIDDFDAINYIT
jgi:hypothetical protein